MDAILRSSSEQRLERAAGKTWLYITPALLLLAIQIKWWWEPGDDASSYLSIARHMSQGELKLFGEAHVRWAPGYAALLAPAFWLSDRPFLLISLIQFVLMLALTLGAYRWFRRVTPKVAAPLTALLLVNVSLWQLYRMTLSEVAFMVWIFWAADILEKARGSVRAREAFAWSMLAAVLITVGGFTRQISVFLVGGYAVTVGVRAYKGELGKGRAVWTTALIGAVSCLGVLALVLWDRERAQAAGTMSYDQYLVDPDMTLLEQTIEGLRIRISATGRLLIPGMHKAYARTGVWLNANVAIHAVVSAAILLGWWRLARRNLDPVLWMTPIYVVFFVFWPHSESTRYWVPLLPVLLASLWSLIESRERSRRWRMRLVALLIVAHALVSTGDWIKSLRDRQLHANWERFDELLADVDPGPRELSGYRLDGDVSRMLLVDRNVRVGNPFEPEEIGANARWLIAPSEVSPPDGFVEAVRFDTLKLLERRSSTP